ncbi:hypothetical protein [Streptomyces sp. NPDC001165]|uniref:hypothetical protein n=1 Tax=Streptomyces sp. NPDC001165 TaxID=3364546 RepID=UPI003689A554
MCKRAAIDDMIATEKDHPGIWNLYGDFSGKDGDGWFANDPVELDPGTDGGDAEHRGNDRLHYLLDRDSDPFAARSAERHGCSVPALRTDRS